MPSGPELLIVLAVIVLLFGASRLPALARSLGEARAEFDKGQHDPRSTPHGDGDATPDATPDA